MSFIRYATLTVSEARELEKTGFVLVFEMMHLDGTDTYKIFVK